ncbi:unnamed protein product [Nyctereutes procyonoides]|uniref:(raccoon dog) hypothetical protein n=1 Tax=Nyctereutes procyonoides TaxID=34880 RepID=A0A811YZ48_NYCPR|nr:unnamed protein product [Nyctereutes procyonoides]
MSAHLQWMVRQDCSSFLMKKTYSTDLNNLKESNSFHYNNNYCPDLCVADICRAGAILCSQKPEMVKRKPAHPTKSS